MVADGRWDGQIVHHEAMLKAGWVAKRDLTGRVVAWIDPAEPKWPLADGHAWLYWQAGDCNYVPKTLDYLKEVT